MKVYCKKCNKKKEYNHVDRIDLFPKYCTRCGENFSFIYKILIRIKWTFLHIQNKIHHL